MKLSQKSAAAFTRILVTGLPGSGKSTLVAKLAERYRLIWITLDNDADILRSLPLAQQENIELIDIPDSAKFPVAAQTLLSLLSQRKGKICNAHGVFNCALCTKNAPTEFTHLDLTTLTQDDIVVIDTVSQLGRSVLAHTMKDKSVETKPERDDWGALRKWTEFFASEFQAARYNLVCIAHIVEAELENGKTKLVPDFGSKGMSASFAKIFSHVVYCDIVNKKHRAYSSSTALNEALTKSRTSFRVEDLAEPSLLPIFDSLKGKTEQSPSTPAAKAVVDLAALAAQMKKG